MRATRYKPGNVKPTWGGVRFPIPNIGSAGGLDFQVPRGVKERWVFAVAFIRMDNKKFPAEPPAEASNGFNLLSP